MSLLWNKCSECGRIMAYKRKATLIGHITKMPKWHYSYSFCNPFKDGGAPDYVCDKCHTKTTLAKKAGE